MTRGRAPYHRNLNLDFDAALSCYRVRHRRFHGNCSVARIRIEQLNAASGTFKMALFVCLIFSAPAARGEK
jgi:hypothetical protein